jgi:methanogenic corrinoid protein MtbC1
MNVGGRDEAVDLATGLADLREEAVLDIVRQRIAYGDDPLRIIEDCQKGMRLVGERYEQRLYYLSGLIMAGEILREVTELVQPILEDRLSGHTSGRVLLGTVQGDIHDLGKNIVHMLLRCYGFEVHDLGVDVPPAEFVAQARAVQPSIVGLSGLLTNSYQAMRETVAQLRAAVEPGSPQVPIIIGGRIDEQVCHYVGADYWTTDAMEGVRLCQRLGAG